MLLNENAGSSEAAIAIPGLHRFDRKPIGVSARLLGLEAGELAAYAELAIDAAASGGLGLFARAPVVRASKQRAMMGSVRFMWCPKKVFRHD